MLEEQKEFRSIADRVNSGKGLTNDFSIQEAETIIQNFAAQITSYYSGRKKLHIEEVSLTILSGTTYIGEISIKSEDEKLEANISHRLWSDDTKGNVRYRIDYHSGDMEDLNDYAELYRIMKMGKKTKFQKGVVVL